MTGGKILHVDKLEVWKKAIDRAKMENPTGFKNGAPAFGISLLLGYICLLNGEFFVMINTYIFKGVGCIKASFHIHKRWIMFAVKNGVCKCVFNLLFSLYISISS